MVGGEGGNAGEAGGGGALAGETGGVALGAYVIEAIDEEASAALRDALVLAGQELEAFEGVEDGIEGGGLVAGEAGVGEGVAGLAVVCRKISPAGQVELGVDQVRSQTA